MGIFSSIMDFTGVGQAAKLLRTGATQAGKDAVTAGEQTLAQQQALSNEIGGIYQPRIDAGNNAFNSLNSFYNGDQQAIINQAQSSPFMSGLVGAGENAIARNSQATGGFRSGTTQENLAENEQSVLMGLVNQMLQGKQGIAQSGFGAQDSYSNAMQNIVAGQGNTRGQIANVGINQAAQRGNQIGGLVNAGASIFSASDIKLKSNIVKIGTRNNFDWYSWDWNKLANKVGLVGSDEGHIAQEVQKLRPDLVTTKNGYLAVNYGGF